MCPPGTLWYSSDSAQLSSSGPKRGTVTAIVPPGRSTRASSPIACDVVGDVLEHLGADDAVETRVGERQVQRVALHARGVRVVRDQLARVAHRGEHVRDAFDLVAPRVQGHDVRAAPGGLEGVAPESAAEVEHGVAVAKAQPVVVGGQHQSKRMASGSGSCARIVS